MANVHSALLNIDLRGTINDANATGFGTVAALLRLAWPKLELGNGNGSGNTNKIYVNAVTLPTAGTRVQFDLADGTLKDVLGNALVFGRIAMLAFWNKSNNLLYLDTQAGAVDPWLGIMPVSSYLMVAAPGGITVMACGGANGIPGSAGTITGGANNLNLVGIGSGATDIEIAIIGSAS